MAMSSLDVENSPLQKNVHVSPFVRSVMERAHGQLNMAGVFEPVAVAVKNSQIVFSCSTMPAFRQHKVNAHLKVFSTPTKELHSLCEVAQHGFKNSSANRKKKD
jgi:hypothetical protein